MNWKLIALLSSIVGAAWFLCGCADKEVDPSAPVDAPGYYNGPMKAKGGNSEGTNTEEGKQ